MSRSDLIRACVIALIALRAAVSMGDTAPVDIRVDQEGTVHLPAVQIPYSDLASPQAKRNFIERRGPRPSRAKEAPAADTPSFDIQAVRREVDEDQKPGFERLLRAFPVIIEPKVIGGVATKVITPKAGILERNKNRVLINLHGGGTVAWTYGAQEESIPIASLAGIKVITVDYRMAPEWHFPAASEDVAQVYADLLKSYRPKNIGLYGCSSGADLTAQSVAWFQSHHLPRPGAIGMFGSGAAINDRWGDSNYVASPLMGGAAPAMVPGNGGAPREWNYLEGSNLSDPLVTPGYHAEVLKAFPPSLLISGTRDTGLSVVVYTHAQLVDLGVDAELHVWEGADHCSFAQGHTIDADVPENRQAWKVIVQFFDSRLGKSGKESDQRSASTESPSWPQPPRAPAGAPNVVIVLLDDVGFGASQPRRSLAPQRLQHRRRSIGFPSRPREMFATP